MRNALTPGIPSPIPTLMNRSFWLAKAAKFIVLAAAFAALATLATQYLWNHLVPELFHGPALTFWQTLGLLVLSRILFGGWGRGGRGNFARGRAWKQRMEQRLASFTPEEREKFRQQMRSRCMGNWAGRPAAEAAEPA